jgi:uncharacterized protein DUF7010
MEIAQAQKDVRETFLGGVAGQFVSGTIWLLSAIACTWHSLRLAELIAIFGGFFIFPLTQLLLRCMGHAYSLPKGHPMNGLAIQIAFTVGLTIPVVLAATILQPAWFYPALMITVGAHYLPFIFLYGMGQFGVLSALLTSAGVLLGFYGHGFPSAGAWFTAMVLFAFALIGRHAVRATAPPAN